MRKQIRLGDQQLHYIRFGSGRRLLLAFHGYGNTADIFAGFESHLGKEFTVLSFDLPHHGNSVWPEHLAFEKSDLMRMIEAVVTEFKTKRFSLMGYSLGGRVCLTIAELMPEMVEQMLLIAPDGLVFNPLYYFVTQTFLGKRMFQKFLMQPQRYMKWLETMKNRKMIDASRYHFAMRYIGSDADRNFLLKVWPGMRHILPDMKKLRGAINHYKLPVYIFMGSHDRIIPPVHGERFSRGLPTVKLFVVDKGHRVFDADTMPAMAQYLINQSC